MNSALLYSKKTDILPSSPRVSFASLNENKKLSKLHLLLQKNLDQSPKEWPISR